jgi:4,5-DOPA dioxygenase extradiol
MSSAIASSSSPRLPVYFLGIGGPNFIENTAHPAYAKLGAIGREITTQVKPKAIVVFSAHWQEGPSKIKINAAEETNIIYNFYNFPPHYYQVKFPNRGSPALAQKVIDRLGDIGIEVEKVQQGSIMVCGRDLSSVGSCQAILLFSVSSVN